MGGLAGKLGPPPKLGGPPQTGQVPPPALPAPMGPIHPPPRYGGPGGIGGWQGFFWGFLWGFLRVRKEVGGRFLWSPRDLRLFLAGC